ncbi:unnamed protein product [Strongylus vulgaris]|uniref:SAGA-associated factor 11 n=1 Tax=Strongylus vulgaris TaxID=40348 RepID=A0A3P7KAN0_STRVU|nr:unnamed protein product [Strongylus vulgaris]
MSAERDRDQNLRNRRVSGAGSNAEDVEGYDIRNRSLPEQFRDLVRELSDYLLDSTFLDCIFDVHREAAILHRHGLQIDSPPPTPSHESSPQSSSDTPRSRPPESNTPVRSLNLFVEKIVITWQTKSCGNLTHLPTLFLRFVRRLELYDSSLFLFWMNITAIVVNGIIIYLITVKCRVCGRMVGAKVFEKHIINCRKLDGSRSSSRAAAKKIAEQELISESTFNDDDFIVSLELYSPSLRLLPCITASTYRV